jgi:hypothetical protein
MQCDTDTESNNAPGAQRVLPSICFQAQFNGHGCAGKRATNRLSYGRAGPRIHIPGKQGGPVRVPISTVFKLSVRTSQEALRNKYKQGKDN